MSHRAASLHFLSVEFKGGVQAEPGRLTGSGPGGAVHCHGLGVLHPFDLDGFSA